MTLKEFSIWLQMNRLQIDRLHTDASGFVLVARKETTAAWSAWPVYQVHGVSVHRAFLALMAQVAEEMP